ncbi:MAG: hypothetical protein PHV55_08785, partial [Candidatus Omnitrophica bacterium]|nr:hypothetical protein [Candidatus Omnitrophota bacterium]
MRCPSRKDWVLFYYNDTASSKEALSAHLKVCAHCRKEQASLISSLESITKDRVTLPKPDLDAMIARAQTQSRRAGIAALKEKIADVLSQIRLRLLYQPQIAFVALLVMVGLVVIPLSISSPMRLAEAD